MTPDLAPAGLPLPPFEYQASYAGRELKTSFPRPDAG
jgi:hypothetical protein